MKSGTSTAGTKTVFVSRTRMILISPDSLDIRIFSGFGVTTLVGVEDTDISVCVRSVGGSGLQITIPGPRAKERC